MKISNRLTRTLSGLAALCLLPLQAAIQITWAHTDEQLYNVGGVTLLTGSENDPSVGFLIQLIKGTPSGINPSAPDAVENGNTLLDSQYVGFGRFKLLSGGSVDGEFDVTATYAGLQTGDSVFVRIWNAPSPDIASDLAPTPLNGGLATHYGDSNVHVVNDGGTGIDSFLIHPLTTLHALSTSPTIQRGNFGEMIQTDTNRFSSEVYGELEFANGGVDHSRAFSHSLQADLQDQDGGIYSPLYGWLTPNPWGIAQWVVSDHFGLVHFGEDAAQYQKWVYSERFGWMSFVEAENGERYLWVDALWTWLAVYPDGTFYSFDFGWMVPLEGSLTHYDSRIGILIHEEQNPKGWLRSDRFGYVWFARDGTGVWFWSSNRNEWLGITPGGGIWSTAESKFLP